MTFETNGLKVRSVVTVPHHLRGWSNIVHGGILSTICDEIMAWAAIVLTRRFILTRTMTTVFLKPVFTGTRLEAYGYVKKRLNERNVQMEGELFDEKGEKCVSCSGEFVLYSREQFKKFNVVPEEYLSKMADLFLVNQ